MGGCLSAKPAEKGQPAEEVSKDVKTDQPPAGEPAPAAPAGEKTQAAESKQLRKGDSVRVDCTDGNGGFEGKVVRCTTTDVLVKNDKDDKEKWVDMEDVVMSRNRPPLDTEVAVGQEISTKDGITGTVLRRTTTEVVVRTEVGREVVVEVEDITVLLLSIRAAEGLHNKDWIGKSDPYCTCEIAGKPKSKVQTITVTDRLDPVWDFEARIVSFGRGDTLNFEVYDSDANIPLKSDDFLGKVSLGSDKILVDGGFVGLLPLLDEAGNAGMGVLSVNAKMENLAPAPEDPPAQPANESTQQNGPQIVEVKQNSSPCCC